MDTVVKEQTAAAPAGIKLRLASVCRLEVMSISVCNTVQTVDC